MRVVASSLIAAGTVAGIAGAVLAYQSASPTPAPAPAVAAIHKPAPVVIRLLPCERGTRLVAGTCVRIKHRVVVHQEPAPVRQASLPTAAVARTREAARTPATAPAREEPTEVVAEAETEPEDHGVEPEAEAQDD